MAAPIKTADGISVGGDCLLGAKGDVLEFVGLSTELRARPDNKGFYYVVVLRLTDKHVWTTETGPVDNLYYEIALPISDLNLVMARSRDDD